MFPPSEFDQPKRFRVHLCFGPNCTPRGSRQLLPILYAALEQAGIAADVEVVATTCRNRCETGPSVNVYPGPVFYQCVTAEGIEEIVRGHLVGGRPVARLIANSPTRPPTGIQNTLARPHGGTPDRRR